MAVRTASPNPIPSRIPRESISAAVAALLEWIQSQPKHQKAQLFEHDDLLYLSLALTKIPSKSRTNPYRIPLPHPLHPFDPQSTSICLLLDDRPSSPLPPAAALDQIRARALPISSVIGLSELESDYKPYESRRKLCDSYDLFFADRKILPLLPRLLGKHFFKRKKIPLAVDSSRVGWPEQIKSWCESSLLYLRSGSCSMLKIGRVNMTKDEIVENAAAAVEGAMGSVLKKWGNLRSLHVKTAESLALPVYQAVPEIGMKIEGVWDEKKGGSFVKGKKRGRDEGRKGKKEKKGRIHDIGALDEGCGGALDEDGGGEEVLGVEKMAKKKLKMGGNDEVEGAKKRKKDAVSNDKEEEQVNDESGVAKGIKKTGKHAGSELNENKLKKKMGEDAVVASVGVKKSKSNKKKGADELLLNDELGMEKGMKKSKPNKKGADELILNDELGVEKGMKKKIRKVVKGKGIGDDEDVGMENVGGVLSEKKVKKMKKVEGDEVVASGETKKTKPKKRRVKV